VISDQRRAIRHYNRVDLFLRIFCSVLNYQGCKKILEKDDKQIYVFSNFSIELNINETSYMFDFHHHKLSPNIAKLLEHNTFSDSDSDGFESDISPNYKNILNEQIRDDFDDYIKIDLCDIGE